MRRSTLLLLLATVFQGDTAAAQPMFSGGRDVQTTKVYMKDGLKGLQRFGVVVRVTYIEGAQPPWLTDDVLKTDVELRLRALGLPVSNDDVVADLNINTTAQSHFLYKSVFGPHRCRVLVAS